MNTDIKIKVLQLAINDLTKVLQEETQKKEAEELKKQNEEQMKDVLQEYFELRKSLLINKILELNSREHMKDYLSREAYLREFGTLRLDFGRQTGNSFFIKEIDKKMSNVQKKPSICAIFFNHNIRKHTNLENIVCMTKYQLFNNPIKLSDYQTVIVDNSSVFESHEIQKIYDLCSIGDRKSNTELIILT